MKHYNVQLQKYVHPIHTVHVIILQSYGPSVGRSQFLTNESKPGRMKSHPLLLGNCNTILLQAGVNGCTIGFCPDNKRGARVRLWFHQTVTTNIAIRSTPS